MSRRGLLLGGAALLMTGSACTTAPPAPEPGPPAEPPPSAPAPLTAPVVVERVRSAARGTDVNLVLITPEGVPAADLPVCLALHGRGANARVFLDLGLPAALTAAVRSGMKPFAVAAVDGDHYWVRTTSDDDPQRMLREEVPGWVTHRGLREPSAAFGISMGAFGALRYARDRPDLKAVAACSAALFVSWPDAKSRKVFRDQAQWEAEEPLRHTDELRDRPIGLWCGNSDPFVAADRKFSQAAKPEVSAFSAGAHNDTYWKRVLPDIVKFVGAKIT
ncbi:alpha/beta hydrolase [Amycolatopsis xylanica]